MVLHITLPLSSVPSQPRMVRPTRSLEWKCMGMKSNLFVSADVVILFLPVKMEHIIAKINACMCTVMKVINSQNTIYSQIVLFSKTIESGSIIASVECRGECNQSHHVAMLYIGWKMRLSSRKETCRV